MMWQCAEIMEELAMSRTQVKGGGAWMAMDDDPRRAPSFGRLLMSITGVTFMGQELRSFGRPARVLDLPHGRIVVAPTRTVSSIIGPQDIDTGVGWAWGGRGVTVVLVLCQDEPGGMPVRIHLIRGSRHASCAGVFPWMGLERDMMSGELAYTMEGMLRMMADEIMEEVRG